MEVRFGGMPTINYQRQTAQIRFSIIIGCGTIFLSIELEPIIRIITSNTFDQYDGGLNSHSFWYP